ncbi:hypothetical protein AKJ53_00275 [candidate division MSBL1 archaeon SCGC-AAA382F02]|uniref:Phosphoribosylformylglycinamidine synthase subunit PurQ n=1 Tax=candidate division MSBL1 archaeon SCGC-AAA382F02 TaxID=1698282 RepID=A0A133VJ43_9EURY|nr:hypothetical protein AKJ53_00275 [candidate division MSBL1 archaeon SCGC-AAA382F02]
MSETKACVLRVGGTNCDAETKRALDEFEGVESEIIHINQLEKEKNLLDYDCLVFPGGFSYGDHIRAGAVFANKITTSLRTELENFVESGGLIMGICNGFQVLIETGLLPGFEGISKLPTASLAINESAKYECRWIRLKNENNGNCVFTQEINKGKKLFIPIGHKEGRFILKKENEKELLEKLYENDQIVFRYCDKEGSYANGKYPENPNGAFHDIAGICDPSGRIFGLMPHPERAYYGEQLPNWTQKKEVPEYADGRLIFESMMKHLL